MTREEIFRVWAPPDSVWSPWVAPAIFAELVCDSRQQFSPQEIDWGFEVRQNAVILDLDGADSIAYGMALATQGFRPIAMFNATPGPLEITGLRLSPTTAPSCFSTVNLTPVVDALCAASPVLATMSIPADARPVFLLEAKRFDGHRSPQEEMFDNRWVVFPQDFPSASFLLSKGIRQVTLVQHHREDPQTDLSHVLLRWQENGIAIFSQTMHPSHRTPIKVSRPSSFKSAWYRALTVLGLRRSAAGGFGSHIPEESSGSGYS